MVYAGIDLGGTNIKAGLVGEDLQLICKASRPTGAARSADDIIADMADMILTLAKENGVPKEEITGVGIGIPGASKNGVVIELVNLYWKNVPLAAAFHKHLDVPVMIDNDGTVAGVYEYHLGVLAGCKVGILLTLGTGIGGGIVLDGKPFNGAHGLGGELGHLPIVPGGHACTCGNRGCFERYASASALVGVGRKCVVERPESMLCHMADGDYRNVTAKMVFDCAKKGDAIAEALVDEYISYLTMGMTVLMNAFDPEVIALGGGVSAAGEFLLNKVTTAMEGRGVFDGQPYAQIKIAQSGNDAGIIGAAMLAR